MSTINILKYPFVLAGLISSDEVNNQIRDGYNKAVTNSYQNNFVPLFTQIHLNHQSIAESVAKQASAERVQLKYEAQDNNTFFEKAYLYARDKMPSFGGGRKKTSEEKAYSAFSTGGGDLGLENNGFKEIRKVWEKINKETDLVVEKGIYPEIISHEQTEVFNYVQEIGGSIEAAVQASGIVGMYEMSGYELHDFFN